MQGDAGSLHHLGAGVCPGNPPSEHAQGQAAIRDQGTRWGQGEGPIATEVVGLVPSPSELGQ